MPILTKTKEKEQKPARIFSPAISISATFLFFSVCMSSFFFAFSNGFVTPVFYSEAARVEEEQERLLKELEEKAAEEAEKLAKAQAAAEAGINLEGQIFGMTFLLTLFFLALCCCTLHSSIVHLSLALSLSLSFSLSLSVSVHYPPLQRKQKRRQKKRRGRKKIAK